MHVPTSPIFLNTREHDRPGHSKTAKLRIRADFRYGNFLGDFRLQIRGSSLSVNGVGRRLTIAFRSFIE